MAKQLAAFFIGIEDRRLVLVALFCSVIIATGLGGMHALAGLRGVLVLGFVLLVAALGVSMKLAAVLLGKQRQQAARLSESTRVADRQWMDLERSLAELNATFEQAAAQGITESERRTSRRLQKAVATSERRALLRHGAPSGLSPTLEQPSADDGARGWARLGLRLAAEGHGREAAIAYERALLLEPTRVRWRCALVEILLRDGQQREAYRHGATLFFDAQGSPETMDEPSLVRLARLVGQGLPAELARDSLDLCIGDPPSPGRALVARRKLPGYVSPIEPESLARAAAAATEEYEGEAPRRIERVSTRAFKDGSGRAVDGVIRHEFRVGDYDLSLVQKTVVGAGPREVLLHVHGLLPQAGSLWRAMHVYHAAEESTGRWQLVMEDLGDVTPLRTSTAFVAAARSLGELHVMSHGVERHEQEHPWLFRDADLDVQHFLPTLKGVAAVREERLPDVMKSRLLVVLEKLHERAADVERAYHSLPKVLAHGDALPGHATPEGERFVWFDWGLVHAAGVGYDLGPLLLGPIDDHPRQWDTELIDTCLVGYRQQLAEVGVCEEQVVLGYRYNLLWRVLRKKLGLLRRQGLPSVLGRPALAPGASAGLLADLEYLCDEAEGLLQSV